MNNILTTTTAMTHGLILKDNFWIFFQIFSSFGVRDWSALDLRNGLKFNPFRAKATLNVVCPLKLLAFATERLSLLFRCLTTLWKGTYREVSQGEVSRWNIIAGNVPIVAIISTLLHPNLLRTLSFCCPTQHFPELFSPNLTHVSTTLFLQQLYSCEI